MKIGIALGGGGAKGFAHIGVLTALSQAGIECDVIAGTSIGALVGAVYASGNIQKLKEASTRIKLAHIPLLLGPTWPRQGFFSGRRVFKLLNELLEVENIEDLKKSFAAVCADLQHGEIVTLTQGDLRRAVRASIAIPAVFTPVVFEGRLLVDGGVLEPLPVEAARRLGAHFVIAVDLLADSNYGPVDEEMTEPGEKPRGPEPSIADIILRTSVVTQQRLTGYRLKEHPPDFIIKPAVSRIGMFDFHRGGTIIKIGEQAANEVLPELIGKIGREISGGEIHRSK